MSRDSAHYPSVSYKPTNTESRPSEITPNLTALPASPYSERPAADMATLPPPQSHIQQQDPYRSHTGYAMYSSPHSQSYAPQSTAAPSSQVSANFPSAQPAPRQRTAIACRYCRRRKIRCHGFDSSPDGRCTNCMRFHQECIFTPVSSQAHAFVPAHTAYPHLRNNRSVQTGPDGRPIAGYANQPGPQGPPLYGAHGQPLAPVGQHEAGYAPPPQSQAGYPPAPYPPQSGPLPPPAPMHYDERISHSQEHRTTPIQRRGSSNYEYPDPTHMAPTSPVSSATSYQSGGYPPSGAQPYYPVTPGDRRTSPTSSYFASRSGPPSHGHSTATVLPPLPTGLHPPQSLPATYDNGRNSSPSTSQPRTSGLSVADMLTPPSATRSSTDSDMLNALNRNRR